MVRPQIVSKFEAQKKEKHQPRSGSRSTERERLEQGLRSGFASEVGWAWPRKARECEGLFPGSVLVQGGLAKDSNPTEKNTVNAGGVAKTIVRSSAGFQCGETPFCGDRVSANACQRDAKTCPGGLCVAWGTRCSG